MMGIESNRVRVENSTEVGPMPSWRKHIIWKDWQHLLTGYTHLENDRCVCKSPEIAVTLDISEFCR